MKNLFEKLESNTICLKQLSQRYERTKTSNYYNLFFVPYGKREEDLAWILKLRKRVLRMRFKLLEKITIEAFRHMHYARKEMSHLIDKIKA